MSHRLSELLDSSLEVYHFLDPTTEALKASPIQANKDMVNKAFENGWTYDLTTVEEKLEIYAAGNASFYLTKYRYSYFLATRIKNGLPRNMQMFKVL